MPKFPPLPTLVVDTETMSLPIQNVEQIENEIETEETLKDGTNKSKRR